MDVLDGWHKFSLVTAVGGMSPYLFAKIDLANRSCIRVCRCETRHVIVEQFLKIWNTLSDTERNSAGLNINSEAGL